jgi:hypothetical protein
MIARAKGHWRTFVKNAIATIRDTISQHGRYYRYGIDDDLPNQIIAAVNDSGTARITVKRKHEFIFGHGLPQEVAGIRANDKQTLDALVDQLALMTSYMEGFCIQAIYNNMGEIGELHSIPVQHVRRKQDGGFIYAPEYGDEQFSLYNKGRSNAAHVPEFGTCKTPEQKRDLIKQQIEKYGEQLGEFLYVFTPGVGPFFDKYAIPSYFSGIDDIRADASLSRLELRNISNGFNTGIVISTGPIDDSAEDEQGLTAYDRFKGDLENFVGEDAAAILHIMSSGDGDKAQVSRVDVDKLMDATELSTMRIANKICRLMGVPPILIGIETAGKLGNSQELVNMMKLFALSLQREQLKIENALKLLLPELADKIKIEPLRLFDYIPDQVMNILSEEEKRDLYDLAPLVNDDEPERDESVAISADNALNGAQVTAMVTVVQSVAEGAISPESAALILSNSFPISYDAALQIASGAIKTPTP